MRKDRSTIMLKVPSATTLGRISDKIFRQNEHARLQSALNYYSKDMHSLLQAMHVTAQNGYSIMEHPVYLPEPVLTLFRKKGYKAECYLRRDNGKYETAISWYKEKQELT